VTIDASVLYNPNFSYSEFLCPGLIFAQLQVMIMIAAILLFNAEYRRSRGVGAPASRGGPLAMLAARSTPACAVFSAVALLVVELLFPCFNIRFNGPRLPMLGLILLFIIASFVPGVLIGLLAKKSVSGLALGILINMPAFIFSGFTFPTWAFPGPLAALAQALPFSHFAPAFFQIALVNAPLHYALPECCRLALFAMAPLPCIVYIFARRHHAGAARPPRHGEAVS
jgi:ABC-2 type transport system permease protein